jgi:hypothetical protein
LDCQIRGLGGNGECGLILRRRELRQDRVRVWRLPSRR